MFCARVIESNSGSLKIRKAIKSWGLYIVPVLDKDTNIWYLLERYYK